MHDAPFASTATGLRIPDHGTNGEITALLVLLLNYLRCKLAAERLAIVGYTTSSRLRQRGAFEITGSCSCRMAAKMRRYGYVWGRSMYGEDGLLK